MQSVFHILLGSSFGLFLRLFINYKFRKQIVFNINNVSLVNILASLCLGILVALNPVNKNLLLLFYVGFLGCFSTFSSFIYQLFNLIREKKYLILLIYYAEVIVLSFLFFCLGYFITLTFIN